MNSKEKIRNQKKSNLKQQIATNHNYFIIPLILVSCVIPFIMRLHVYKPNLKQFTWFWDMDTYTDFFLYSKQIALILISSIMTLLIFYLIIKKKIKFKLFFSIIPMLFYVILSLFSTLFSKYLSYGITGSFEQFESIFALLSYFIIVIYAYNFVKNDNDLRYFFKFFLISIIILGIIGLSQFLSHDILMSNIIKKIYIPFKYWNKLDNYAQTMPPNTTYLTMYNPNYAGVYTSLVIPILIVLLITCRNIKSFVAYALGLAFMMLCLYGSGSEAGKIAVICCIFIIILFFRSYIFRNKKIVLLILSITVIFIISLIVVRYDSLKSSVINIFSLKHTNYILTDIKTEDNLTITYNKNDLVIKSYLDSGIMYTELYDQNNVSIPYNMDSATGKISINDERFKLITLTPVRYQKVVCIDVNIDNKDWYFTNQLGDNTFYYLTPMNRFDKIVKAKSAVFTGYENIASDRGYIWSRTIPLLKDSIFLGSGADSFVFTFPHQDYLYNYYAGFDGALLTRPHSLYLQIGVQTGLLSLIAFLTFYTIYFVNCFRLFWRSKFTRYYEKVGTGIFIGTISYMITGLTNDSSITVAPVFWVLIGIGTAINHILLTEETQSKIQK